MPKNQSIQLSWQRYYTSNILALIQKYLPMYGITRENYRGGTEKYMQVRFIQLPTERLAGKWYDRIIMAFNAGKQLAVRYRIVNDKSL